MDDPETQRADAAETYRERADRIYRTSLKVWWAQTYGCLAILDPFTGEVYEVERLHPNTPRWMTWRAMEEKTRRKSGTSRGWRWQGSSD